ncbi:TenA family transcriptional regulator [Noviherbaspirillum sp. ST9]|uniref:TenA family transcriptional regulator n=1 Tax=Noviherbaspirillum sp. ST9 TaxID=3401606 RepID=UPI003B58A964
MRFYEVLLESTRPERERLFSVPVIQDALRGDIVTAQYLAFLGQAYHHVRHTVPLLMACGSRLGPGHEWLRRAIAEYIEEEIGHEEWILSDIEACGGDPQKVRASSPHISTDVMVAYAYHQVDRRNPVGFLGMVHVLEGTSTALATNAANTLQVALGLPAAGFTYLNSHGSLDLEHVRFFEGLVNRLSTDEDKAAVVQCARVFYTLYGDIFRSLPNRTALLRAEA